MTLFSIIKEVVYNANFDLAFYTEIVKVFNINLDNPHDINFANKLQQKLSLKLFQILRNQGRNYRNYLLQPKFNLLKPSTFQKLFLLLKEIWDRFQPWIQNAQNQANQYRIDSIQRMIPEFTRIQQIEDFHLELFKSFKSSRLCRQNKEDQKLQNIQAESNQNLFSRQRGNISMINSQPQYINLPSNNSHLIYPKLQEDHKFPNPIWNDRKFIQSQNGFPIPRASDFQNPAYPVHQNIGISPQKYNFIQNQSKPNPIVQRSLQNLHQTQDQDQNRSFISGTEEQFLSKLHQYMFSECVCEGNLQERQKYMVCKECQFYFHLQCLFLDSITEDKLCPCCKLKQGGNLFMKIHSQPISKRWCVNMKSQKLSVYFTEKQIEKIKSQRQSMAPGSIEEYQLRFFKIKKSKNLNGTNIRSQSIPKLFSSLPLPRDFMNKIQPMNMFDISIKKNDKNEEDEESIYIFVFFLIEKFSQETLTSKLFSNLNESNSVGEEMMQSQLGNRDFITIKLKDQTTQKRIMYPVRGNKCQHTDVFDYLNFIEHYKDSNQKLKVIHCLVCDAVVQNIVVDRFVMEKINKFYEQNPEKELLRLKYFGKGQVQYITEQEQQELSSQSEQNGSSQSDDSEALSS